MPRPRISILILLILLQFACSAYDLFSGFWLFWVTSALLLWGTLEIVNNYRRPGQLQQIVSFRGILLVLPGLLLAGYFSNKYARVQYSKYQIYQYIHGKSFPRTPWNLEGFPDPYAPSLGWCINGNSATINRLYGGTAEREFRDPNADIRLRALQARFEIYGFPPFQPFPSFIEILVKAKADPDARIRKLAAEFKPKSFW